MLAMFAPSTSAKANFVQLFDGRVALGIGDLGGSTTWSLFALAPLHIALDVDAVQSCEPSSVQFCGPMAGHRRQA
eukprot:CAMPEP_0183350944 /NCGR_PEP_ID=MMETSP0164_2-20130417/22182_1 /TAXON_ID=221442 /ORGANISM="Coccolithus pelagicus ssp braarudi, Strain PLY182g" /LENGTH=74 /DNA_ID=CAMNT_0025522989 /DNA_START=487 /DNA_END=709 /DNA_ORIENTATION=-